MGFGGMLNFPSMTFINTWFSVWLMSRVEVTDQSIIIDESKLLRFTKEDVRLGFGIPCSGMSVVDKNSPLADAKKFDFMRSTGLDPKECRSVKAVQEVLQRDYGTEMSELEECAFRVAFVVFVMSSLLAPSTKHDYATADYWNALAEPLKIGEYDWSAFVIETLMEAVVKLESGMKRKIGITNISGCSLFLQVLYLDSTDLGVWNIDHDVTPRIKFFITERMKNMINVASLKWDRGPNGTSLLASSLRPADKICYGWARDASKVQCFQGVDGQIRQAVIAVADEFKVPSQVEGIKLTRKVASILGPYSSAWTVPYGSQNYMGVVHGEEAPTLVVVNMLKARVPVKARIPTALAHHPTLVGTPILGRGRQPWT